MLLSASALVLLGSTAWSFSHDLAPAALPPEPFLIVGLVATMRRILVLTAELTAVQKLSEPALRLAMIELGLLTVMIVALVASLMMLRGRNPRAVATRP